MKSYKAYIKQDCEGCDYTISCAEKILDLEGATTMREAEDMLLKIVHEDYLGDEVRLKHIEIFEVSDSENLRSDLIYKIVDSWNSTKGQRGMNPTLNPDT